MLIQPPQAREAPMTEIALIGVAVPRPLRGLIRRRSSRLGASIPPDQLLGQHAVGVPGPHELVQRLAVDVGRPRAAAALEMVREGCGGGVARGAEGADYVCA